MLRTLAFASVVGLAFAACDSPSGSGGNGGSTKGEGVKLPDGTTFTRAALLDSFAQCTLSNARAFQTAAESLARVAGDAAKIEEARDAWTRAMESWERLEVMQFGPTATSALPGGKNLRDSIYAWPLGGRCPVEQEIVEKKYESAAFVQELVTKRGLLSVEYLLFADGTSKDCAPTVDLTSLAAEDLTQRKLAYAKVATADVLNQARAIVDAWDPQKGNFVSDFVSAGRGSKVYSSESVAFNNVSDSIFYVEWATKDMKLGRPAGLSNCTTPTCPEALESVFAHASKVHVRNNLLGFKALFFGCADDGSGLGFDDYLVAVGAPQVADDVRRGLDDAIAKVDAIEEPDLAQALSTDLESVKALYDSIRKMTDTLKTEFVSVLDLEVPARVEGDND